jgi:hypothetical protein
MEAEYMRGSCCPNCHAGLHQCSFSSALDAVERAYGTLHAPGPTHRSVKPTLSPGA